MKPIPKSLLIHSAALRDVGEDEWQNEKVQSSTALMWVRIEPMSKLVTSSNNRTVTLSAALFYDCRNSRPAGVEFKQGQRLIFGGREYTVETVEELYDHGKLHHLEVGLV